MTSRLLFPAYTYAWLATLASAPLLLAAIWISRLRPALVDAAGYGGLVLLAYEHAVSTWGIAMTLAGALTWPLARRFLLLTRANGFAALGYGVVIGAFCAMAAAISRDAIAGGFDPEVFVAELGETVLIGAGMGLLWAAWFVLLAKLIGANRPEAPGETPQS